MHERNDVKSWSACTLAREDNVCCVYVNPVINYILHLRTAGIIHHRFHPLNELTRQLRRCGASP